ncbi:MAG: hypothetical protein HY981_03655 [Candidatus Magasanikbacteria bacterium]|nr:hypothetical protein [Candidatus Magasanikbacteria bacterium]
MDLEKLAVIKTKLQSEKTRLEEELRQFADQDKHNQENFSAKFPSFGDEIDENAAEVAAYSDNLTLEGTLEKELRDVQNALNLLEKGEYGKCKYCKKDILAERLLARPSSTSCVACKKTLTQEL